MTLGVYGVSQEWRCLSNLYQSTCNMNFIHFYSIRQTFFWSFPNKVGRLISLSGSLIINWWELSPEPHRRPAASAPSPTPTRAPAGSPRWRQRRSISVKILKKSAFVHLQFLCGFPWRRRAAGENTAGVWVNDAAAVDRDTAVRTLSKAAMVTRTE